MAAISEAFLVPVLEEMLVTLPFVVLGFHADNGSEYINPVAEMLKQTARAGLHEVARAALQRQRPGRCPPCWRVARTPDHHPCLFATEVRDGKGNVRRRYRRQDVATPYDKLKSLADAERFLKPGVTFAELDKVALAMSDLEANRRANRARDELLQTIAQANVSAA